MKTYLSFVSSKPRSLVYSLPLARDMSETSMQGLFMVAYGFLISFCFPVLVTLLSGPSHQTQKGMYFLSICPSFHSCRTRPPSTVRCPSYPSNVPHPVKSPRCTPFYMQVHAHARSSLFVHSSLLRFNGCALSCPDLCWLRTEEHSVVPPK